MGRIKAWHNLPPVLQCSRYRRLLEQQQQNTTDNTASDDVCAAVLPGGLFDADDAIMSSSESSDTNKKHKSKSKRKLGAAKRKKDCKRQLVQESFQELMSYSCGQCGHVQTLQAEELKSILGHAFRLAYAAHLQKAVGLHEFPGGSSPPPPPPSSPPPINPVHTSTSSNNSSSSSSKSRHQVTSQSLHSLLNNHHHQESSSSSSPKTIPGYSSECEKTRLHSHSSVTHTHIDQRPCDQTCTSTSDSSSGSSVPPHSITGHKQRPRMRSPAPLPGLRSNTSPHHSCRLSPDSDTSNSPTDHNSSHRLLDKPPLLKQFSVPPLEMAPSAPTHHLVIDPLNNNNTNNNTNNLNTGGIGYINDANNKDNNKSASSSLDCCSSNNILTHNIALDDTDSISLDHALLPNTPLTQSRHSIHSPFHSSSHSQSSPLHSIRSQSPVQCGSSPLHSVLSSQSHPSPVHSTQCSVLSSQSSCSSSGGPNPTTAVPSPPPLPERSDSLAAPDEPHLRAAAWFQAGIPREIALEVLGQEPQGAFLVRESSSKPGCYALSLRVPTDFAEAGIAHYLIVRSNRGYRIKGFTKEFPTLRTLITHHSVMPELLPVPLLLTRHNPAYQDQHEGKDPSEEDPDYNTLADFRKMMSDLNV